MNPRINLRHLQTFLAIVEEGTLTAAAERQLKSQGAISQDLASLETECGLKLIDRSGQRVKLTPAGEALLPEAREILQRVRDVELSMRRIRSGEAGTIRVGALPSITERVAEYLFDFHKKVPEARFELRSELHGSLLEKLTRRELDMAVAMTTLRENLECKVLESEPLFIVVNATHPLANCDSLTPHDVAGYPFVSMMRDVSYARGGKDFFEVVGRYPDPAVRDRRSPRDTTAGTQRRRLRHPAEKRADARPDRNSDPATSRAAAGAAARPDPSVGSLVRRLSVLQPRMERSTVHQNC